jgi:hypothetical protein
LRAVLCRPRRPISVSGAAEGQVALAQSGVCPPLAYPLVQALAALTKGVVMLADKLDEQLEDETWRADYTSRKPLEVRQHDRARTLPAERLQEALLDSAQTCACVMGCPRHVHEPQRAEPPHLPFLCMQAKDYVQCVMKELPALQPLAEDVMNDVLRGASPDAVRELVAGLCRLRARLRALVEPPSATEEGRKQQLQDWGWGLGKHGVKPLWRKLSEEQQEVSIPLCREGSAASPAQQKCMCRVTSAVPT